MVHIVEGSKVSEVALGFSDPVVTQIANEDTVKWYKKPNLRIMYVYLFLCCMGVEMTSGFDSTLIGTLQFSDPWNACTFIPWPSLDVSCHSVMSACRLT